MMKCFGCVVISFMMFCRLCRLFLFILIRCRLWLVYWFRYVLMSEDLLVLCVLVSSMLLVGWFLMNWWVFWLICFFCGLMLCRFDRLILEICFIVCR